MAALITGPSGPDGGKNMQQPFLVVMAAGMGSRFGGLKQIMPVDSQGHAIIDYSLFDAFRAGFRRVVFIIKHSIEEDFKNAVGRRMESYFDVRYVYQELDCLPEGFSVPAGREKPWGTGHAAACCAGVVDAPFAIINSDDFYGRGAFQAIYDFLSVPRAPGSHAMAAYRLSNTLTENGYVSRGICTVKNGFLQDVTERTHIEKRPGGAAFTEDGVNYTSIDPDVPVSMNFWGFSEDMLPQLQRRFRDFLAGLTPAELMKAEFYLPAAANAVIKEGLGTVKVLECGEQWHGVTYREDMQSVRDSIAQMIACGKYPARLWD